MTVTPGTRLGRYDIVSQIGAGGMGEVYRATDTNLKRQVAIKVLPAAVAADTDRLARFQREAEVLAALNHPNIAAIYGLEHTPEFTGLVMELVEGEDLTARIARGPVPLDEAVPIARQIADALEAAHEQGIIHRDLKPANIKVRADGTVKVLDFGLAKAVDPVAAAASHSGSPTITTPARTQAGMILGTAAYMSPEQARGRAVDRRADIWSFGVVLYEMLSGVRAFDGDDVSITLASVLKEDVKWDALPETLSLPIRTLLRRCLEKDPKQRLGWIGESRWLLNAPAPVDTAPSPPAGSHRSTLAWLAAVVMLSALTGAIAWWARSPKPAAEERLTMLAPETSPPQSIAISPDATTTAMIAGDRIWLRKLGDFTATELPGTDGARAVFWSPDGTHLGFQALGQLWRVAATGGKPVAIGTVPGDFTLAGGAAWSPEGRIVFGTGTSTLLQIPADGSAPASPIFQLDPQKDVDLHEPTLLPDGKTPLFVIHPVEGLPYQIYVFVNGERRAVFSSPKGRVARPRYSPTGHLMFQMDGGVWALPFSLATLATTGDPILVANSARQPSVADDGTIVMLSGTASSALALTEVDATGKPGAVIGRNRGIWPRLSPDGRFVAAMVGFGGDTDIWIFDRIRKTERRLTFEPTADVNPSWSPDGQFIVYACGTSVCARPADGGGTRVELVSDAADGVVTPDGRHLVFRRRNGEDSAIYTAAIGPGGLAAPVGAASLVVSARVLSEFDISPDGRYVAYSSRETGVDSVFVTRFPVADGKWEVPVRLAVFPRWSANGDRLFVFDELSRLVEVPVDLARSFAAGVPAVRLGGLAVQVTAGYDRFPDGTAFIVPLAPAVTTSANQVQVMIIRNWVAR